MFFIARLSKCFVTVASKAFIFKEQAYRKALAAVKQATRKKQGLAETEAAQTGLVFT